MDQVENISRCEDDSIDSYIGNINNKIIEQKSITNWKYGRDLIRMGIDEIKSSTTANESYSKTVSAQIKEVQDRLIRSKLDR